MTKTPTTTIAVVTATPTVAGWINPEFTRKCREAAEARRAKEAK